MSGTKGFTPLLTHWSFGITVLVGLISSEFTGAESVVAILLAASTSTISTICSCKTSSDEEQYRRKRLNHILNFLILWLDVLTNLVAASVCARLASATVDYISKGHFREFLFGLEQHSLGEPWPDVLGVTIVLVVTGLFMMGLERSSTISILLFFALLCNFAFFALIGSFHTVAKMHKWFEEFKVHSFRMVLKAAALCSFAFVQRVSMTRRNNLLRVFTIALIPLVFYLVVAVIFSLMTHYRELFGTAIPLIQVFENRDVDWARPLIAVCTICVVCLLLTEIMPSVYFDFVRLASREWKVLVSSIQYQSAVTGAPVLAIFAAGSLAAILAFACPLSHLIKLLNVSSLIQTAATSCQTVASRYKAEIIHGDFQVHTTSVHYSKLGQNSKKSTVKQHQVTLKDRIKGWFAHKPIYVHHLSSPKNLCPAGKSRGRKHSKKREEHEYLLDDKQSLATDVGDESNSENELNEMEILSCSDGEDSGSSTDIDVIVEEYKEGLKVAAVGKFNDNRPSATKLTSIVVVMCLIFVIVGSINIGLFIFKIIHVCWPNVVAVAACTILITTMPQNVSEKSKPCLLPSWLFSTFHCTAIATNIILSATIVADVWQGVVFWTLAGLFLYWRCDCCDCEGLEPMMARGSSKVAPHSAIYEYKESLVDNIFVAR